MSLAMAYALKKKSKKMADGGTVQIDPDKAKKFSKAFGSVFAEGGAVEHPHDCPGCKSCYAKGGAVSDEMIARAMAKYMSEGGMVANDTPPVADFEENDFDVLATDDDLEFHETGENSGDEIGNEQEDEDRDDVVKRAMASWRKKDKLPRPA